MTERERELAKLASMRAEINRQIREARKMGEVEVSGAKIARRQIYARGPEEWVVKVAVDNVHQYTQEHYTRYVSVYMGGSKRECVDAIPGIIGTLRSLYEEATKGERD